MAFSSKNHRHRLLSAFAWLKTRLSLWNVQPITRCGHLDYLPAWPLYGTLLSVTSHLISNLLLSMGWDLCQMAVLPSSAMCALPSSTMAKEGNSRLAWIVFQSLRAWWAVAYGFIISIFLGIQHAWSEFLDLLLKRRSIRYIILPSMSSLDPYDSTLQLNPFKCYQNNNRLKRNRTLVKNGFKSVFG